MSGFVEAADGVRWWSKQARGAPVREGIKYGDRREDGFYFEGYRRGGTGETWVVKCPKLRGIENRAINGGFGSATLKRMFDEEPWVYICYSILSGTGLRLNEANARWLHANVLPEDGKCPCCGKVMRSNAGKRVGKGESRQATSLDAPSVEHVIPKTHPDFHKYNEASILRIVCFRCNTVMGNATPDELQKAADWRRKAQSQVKTKREEYEHRKQYELGF